MKKLLSLLLGAALFLSVPISALAEELNSADIMLNGQTELKGTTVRAEDGTMLSENYLIYTPGPGVVPLVCFGMDVAGAASFARNVELETGAGRHIAAGVNGDFFTLATGVAMGLVIRDGLICSSERISYESLGFKADGTPVLGRCGLCVSLSCPEADVFLKDLCFNKTLTDSNGLVVYSRTFGENNGAKIPSRNLILKTDSGTPIPGGTVYCTVQSIENSTSPVALDDDCMVLSVAENTLYPSLFEAMGKLLPGMTAEICFSVNDEWLDVVNAIGCEHRLIKDGVIDPGLAGISGKAPRTAAGIREDGTLIFYTADGRETVHSAGLSLSGLAARMSELGCVQAVNLDGGASTQLYALYPGTDYVTQVNKSSGSGLRSCADYLALVNILEPDGILSHLNLYPYNAVILAGSTVEFELKGSDGAWSPVDTEGRIPVCTLSSPDLGSLELLSFTAGRDAVAGTVCAYLDGFKAEAAVTVVTRPDTVKLMDSKGAALRSLTLAPGQEYTAAAVSELYGNTIISDGKAYVWSLSGSDGSFDCSADENGIIRAGWTCECSGTLTVSAGGVSTSIPVSVRYTAPKVASCAAVSPREASQNIDIPDFFSSGRSAGRMTR